MFVLVAACLAVSALAGPIALEAPALDPSVLASYSYAVDFSALATVSTFTCLKQNGYQAAFIRGYNPMGQGTFDATACANIQNAYSAGIGTEVYMTPQPASSKQGYQQFDELYSGLTSKGITVRSVWIQVTSPVNWGTSTNTNNNFILSIKNRALQYNVQVGIYTNQYDWNQITGGSTTVAQNTMLWYWNVYGSGINGESHADYSDFRSFGCWTTPTVKQFAQVESVCSTTVNRDIFTSSTVQKMEGMAKYEKPAGPMVGNIGF